MITPWHFLKSPQGIAIGVMALMGLFFYGGLGGYGLLNNNEGLYAEIAREMVQSSDYVLPHLNGVPYIEKPPLLYWLVVLSFKVFGVSAWAARLVPATFGMLTCMTLMWFCRRIGRYCLGNVAAVLLASSCGFIVFSRMVFFDGGLTFFLTLSALTFYRFFETGDRRYVRVFYGSLALGILMKGLVILVLMGMIVVIFCAISRRISYVTYMLDPWGIVGFLALVVPWHVMASGRDPGFMWFYFVNEHIMRFLDQRIPRDYYRGPLYYYIHRFLGYILPWTFILPVLRSRDSPSPLKRFLWVWFLTLFVFFSVSKAKANYYMMVAMPPAVLWIGMGLLSWRYWKIALGSGVAVSLSLMVGGIIYMNTHESHFSMRSLVDELSLSQKKVYLYRRFEELSSLAFYVGHPVPIIDCQSHDLWYGKTQGHRLELFLTCDDVKSGSVVVASRDDETFRNHFQGRFTEQSTRAIGPYKIYYIHGEKEDDACTQESGDAVL